MNAFFDYSTLKSQKKIIRGIQLRAKRTEGEMLDQYKYFFSTKYFDIWKVAANELTWLLRSVTLTSIANVDKNGNVTISHKFEDTFDLRPSSDRSRSIEYDVASIILGFLYHDIAGANDLMKIKGKWNNSYSKEQIDWKVNGTKKIEEAMKKAGEKMQKEGLKWIRDTR